MSPDDDFRAQLLTGDGKWWEFLDPETYEVRSDLPTASRSRSSELDWSRARGRRIGPVGFAFFNHCTDCGQGVPPDFTFCVHCGGTPRSADRQCTYTLVIAELVGDAGREAALELGVAAGVDLSRAEVAALFDELPAVFNVTARRDQVAALTAKLAEVGIAARAFSVDDPSVPWLRETAESLVRDGRKLALVVSLVVVGIALAWWWSWIGLLVALGFVAALFAHQLRWYRRRYHLDARTLLQLVTGFDPDTARVARETLRAMSDRKARADVTLCLMEYYTLTQQLRVHAAVYGAALGRTREALEHLMADVLVLAHRYARLDDFVTSNPPARLEQRIEKLQQREDADDKARALTRREIAALTDQLESVRAMDASRRGFRERLAALAGAMETMRTRLAAVRARPSEEALREIALDDTLRELDLEFEVFEETFAVVG